MKRSNPRKQSKIVAALALTFPIVLSVCPVGKASRIAGKVESVLDRTPEKLPRLPAAFDSLDQNAVMF